ncbi:hypothetical protein HID58_073934 [Brassica napus]|uniref:Replication protein A 70 kDa DNA-binding subunit B/D first OB fold domain-containing protein n=1 Tax=Brassica napus TaxID=3708 RepID=A0ABQ7YFH5_BRANA|nr:hypothetical protein HID58_073934 [Brassica napus]
MIHIRVKVIRLWKQYSVAGGETIEMVFVDEKGDKIHASVRKELVEPINDCNYICLANFCWIIRGLSHIQSSMLYNG